MILAAGTSSRLGRPKQLLPLGGKPLLQHAIDAASEAGLDEVIVVLGHEADDVAAALRLPKGARTTMNPRYAEGQSTSLAAGLRALGPETGAAVILLGDQPLVSPTAIRAVVAVFEEAGGPVVQASYGGRPGHPVLLDRKIWAEIQQVEGDVGARDILARAPDRVTAVEVGGDPPDDVDTWQAYRRIGGDDGGRPPR
ncbi:MAG: nucleotidyltransferase family protein [Actinomycetota bacterium]